MVPGNLCLLSTRAASITAATPEPSSFAPGASDVKFITSVTRLSIWPWIMTTSLGRSVPRWMATMSHTGVGRGTRAPVNVSHGRTVVSPKLSNWPLVQPSAAPIPRFGSVCDDKVCRVPKLTKASIVWRNCFWLTGATIARSFASGDGGGAAAMMARDEQAMAMRGSVIPGLLAPPRLHFQRFEAGARATG